MIPSGFDPQRFENLPEREFGSCGIRLLFAGVVEELMKGFHVLFEACCRLWQVRQDFELWVTAESTNFEAPFLRRKGWKNQTELPLLMAECDLVIVPTIAQEALGRTAVEAMGAARPVIASRLGGLPFTVVEGSTGLLFEPGDVAELESVIQRLMSSPEDCLKFGHAGRQRFLSEHTWEHVLATKYRPLFSGLRKRT